MTTEAPFPKHGGRAARLYARRYLRQMEAQLPFRLSFLSRRRRITDRQRVSLVRLMLALEGPEVAFQGRLAA